MKAITLHQPWASLVVLGAKKIETRSWKTGYRGRLAIHASKTFSPKHIELCHQLRFRAALSPLFKMYEGMFVPMQGGGEMIDPLWPKRTLPVGCIVGMVDLVDCRPTRELRAELNTDDDEWHFGDFTDGPGGFGRYGLILENPQSFDVASVSAIGALGIWEWTGVPPRIDRARSGSSWRKTIAGDGGRPTDLVSRS